MNRRFLAFSLLLLVMVVSARWTLSAAESPASDPFATFPAASDPALSWPWERFATYYEALEHEALSKDNVVAWLSHWTKLIDLIVECDTRLNVAMSANTADAEAEKRYNDFLDAIRAKSNEREQNLRAKLLASGLAVPGMELTLKKLRVQAEIFRAENVPVLVEDEKLSNEYNKIQGAQTVTWDGKETTLDQLNPVYQETDRARRESAWQAAMGRWQKDRAAIGELWARLLALRLKEAANAGFPDYRSYRWKELLRLDYKPEDAKRFHEAIRQVVTPAAARIYAKRQERMRVKILRPWDLDVDPLGRPPLKPFAAVEELENKAQATFAALDPQLGQYFATMRREKTLDLDNRKNKAPGGFMASYDVRRLPLIFMNAVGVHDDVQTVLHEGGHAFHYFESLRLPYAQQRLTATEFDEVASMSMELLAGAKLDLPGGFYNKRDAARARIATLEGIITFWPYMSVVDLFQHWVYEHPAEARDPKNCDRTWAALWDQYMQGVDWSGLEAAKETGWQRKLHIHTIPFYYLEYGIAELGAVQVFGNALKDPKKALADYRRALSLGGTASLPELFAAAGARFSLDEKTLGEAVALLERTIAQLEKDAGV
jgi:oligoendopeptidase F